MLDYVIKSGTIIDGTGAKPFIGDIGIQDGKIVEVGSVSSAAKETVDADGSIVTPGFVDVHTHYDGQVTWDDAIEPSSNHGVTSIVMGNCGVGFAPVRPGEEMALIELMEGVEDIPGSALHEGMPWGEWETFPEYLDLLRSKEYALDVGAQIPHGALRTYVMGERGANNEAATQDDIDEMSRLVEEGMKAGALGFSTSRILGHTSLSGEPVPGTLANDAEFLGIGKALQRAGFGVIESIPAGAIGQIPGKDKDPHTTQQEIELMSEISRTTGRPITFSLFQIANEPDNWRNAMEQTNQANLSGAKLHPQIASRPPGVLISFSAYHPFQRRETYVKLLDLSFEDRMVELRKPEVKAKILSDDNLPPVPGQPMYLFHLYLESKIGNFFVLGDPLDYEPDMSKSIGAIAAKMGRDPSDVLYDELLVQGGRAFLMLMQTNYLEGDHRVIREMMLEPSSIVGLGDGGAHVKLICDGSMQTYAIKHWIKERTRGKTLPAELVVQKLTSNNADLYGMKDRGRLLKGLRADINVIDIDNMELHLPRLESDLPGGFDRLLQPAKGYNATFVNGQITRRFDKDTGVRSGRVISGSA